MITGWLLKIVLGFVVVGFLLVEAGSPIVTRAQLDDIAHDAADVAALELMNTNDVERARASAEQIVIDKDATLSKFEVVTGGVQITVRRQARSVLLKKWKTTADWYDVEVSADASTAVRR